MSNHHVRKAAKDPKVLIIPADVNEQVQLVDWEERGQTPRPLMYVSAGDAWLDHVLYDGPPNERATKLYHHLATPWVHAPEVLNGDFMVVGVTQPRSGHLIRIPDEVLDYMAMEVI